MHTYTVESCDNLTKIGKKYGVAWKSIWDHNRDILDDPDKIMWTYEHILPNFLDEAVGAEVQRA